MQVPASCNQGTCRLVLYKVLEHGSQSMLCLCADTCWLQPRRAALMGLTRALRGISFCLCTGACSQARRNKSAVACSQANENPLG